MAPTTTAPTTQDIEQLTTLYGFREPEAVVRFLAAHPSLVPLLVEARPVIARHFPPATPAFLEVFVDHESEDEDDTELFAMIQTDLPPAEARTRLDRFTREWWVANLPRARRRLEFNVWYP